jgi:predicted PolB exonuclease-like 3'-5' exonuclease
MLAFDIETVPLAAALQKPYNPEEHSPPGNYKNTEAIAGWHEKNAASWAQARVKECSLNPRLGRVVAIAYAGMNGIDGAGVCVTYAREEAEERIMIESFWEQVTDHGQIVSWNGKGFDLPFLVARSIVLKVRPTVDVPQYMSRYHHVPHFDVKAALMNGEVRKAGEGLGEWAQALGMSGKVGHGSDVYEMVSRGQWEELQRYAGEDARLTREIAKRAAPFFSSGTFAIV